MLKIKSIIPLCMTFILLTSTTCLQAKTIYVDDIAGADENNPYEDYTNLIDAVNNASNNDTIYVYSGTYTIADSLVLDKTIFLKGENKNNTFITIDAQEDITKNCIIQIDSDNIEISNFTICPSESLLFRTDGIRVFSDNTIIKNNEVYNTILGIYLKNASNTAIQNNLLKENTLGVSSYINTDKNKIQNNTFLQNYDGGLSFFYENNSVFTGNIFLRNSHFSLNLIQSEYNKIEGNIFSENTQGAIRLSKSSNNIVDNNDILNNSDYGIFLLSSNKNNITKNKIYNHHIGINISEDSSLNIIEENEFYGNQLNTNPKGDEKKNNDLTILPFLAAAFLFFFCLIMFYRKKVK